MDDFEFSSAGENIIATLEEARQIIFEMQRKKHPIYDSQDAILAIATMIAIEDQRIELWKLKKDLCDSIKKSTEKLQEELHNIYITIPS